MSTAKSGNNIPDQHEIFFLPQIFDINYTGEENWKFYLITYPKLYSCIAWKLNRRICKVIKIYCILYNLTINVFFPGGDAAFVVPVESSYHRKTGTAAVLAQNGFYLQYPIDHPSMKAVVDYFEERKGYRPDPQPSDSAPHQQAITARNIVNSFLLFVMSDGLKNRQRVPPFFLHNCLRSSQGMVEQWFLELRQLGLGFEGLNNRRKVLMDFFDYLKTHKNTPSHDLVVAHQLNNLISAVKRVGKQQASAAKLTMDRHERMALIPHVYRTIEQCLAFTREDTFKEALCELRGLFADVEALAAFEGCMLTVEPYCYAVEFVIGRIISIVCIINGHRPGVCHNMTVQEYLTGCEPINQYPSINGKYSVIQVGKHKTGKYGPATVTLTSSEREIFDIYYRMRSTIPGADQIDPTVSPFLITLNKKNMQNRLSEIWKTWQLAFYRDPARCVRLTDIRHAIETLNHSKQVFSEQKERDMVSHYIKHTASTAQTYYSHQSLETAVQAATLVRSMTDSHVSADDGLLVGGDNDAGDAHHHASNDEEQAGADEDDHVIAGSAAGLGGGAGDVDADEDDASDAHDHESNDEEQAGADEDDHVIAGSAAGLGGGAADVDADEDDASDAHHHESNDEEKAVADEDDPVTAGGAAGLGGGAGDIDVDEDDAGDTQYPESIHEEKAGADEDDPVVAGGAAGLGGGTGHIYFHEDDARDTQYPESNHEEKAGADEDDPVAAGGAAGLGGGTGHIYFDEDGARDSQYPESIHEQKAGADEDDPFAAGGATAGVFGVDEADDLTHEFADTESRKCSYCNDLFVLPGTYKCVVH